jgi:FdhE protein
MNAETRIIEIGQIEAPAGEIRFLIPAGCDLFARRAERFRQLSPGHPLGDYLTFLALLADAQQEALSQFPALSLPDSDEQALCREHGMPLLGARSWNRNPAWREALATILQQMREAVLPPAACETVSGLMQASEACLEEMADRILAGDLTDISPHELPFVAAALQVYWVHMASILGDVAFGRLEQGGVCPVCGSYPSIGIVGSDGAEQGLRYLCCSLCASRWHMVRIKCSSCESTHEINHYILEGSNGAVKAESCDDCNSYLKLLYLEKDSQMEAMADDLATLALDMLMDKEGKLRGGPNLFFHPGRSEHVRQI